MAVAAAVLSSPTTARANVYATDILVNGHLFGVTNTPTPASPVTITYHINDASATNVTVAIMNGSTTVATISGGYAFGLNTVKWGGTNNSGAAVPGAAYSISITAKASGYPFWTQISTDGANTAAVYAHGLTVDNNTNSPYYGRVFMDCALNASAHGVSQLVGIYKYNADATPADEGSFGYGGYTTNNSGNVDTANAGYTVPEMPIHGSSTERELRMGTDDRVYMNDYSDDGSVIAFDPLISTNQIVIDQGSTAVNYPPGGANFSGNSTAQSFTYGVDGFDVMPTGANAAVYLTGADYPGWGVTVFHMVPTGTADPADNVGEQAVYPNGGSTPGELLLSSGGCMVDTNLDVFVSADRANAGDANERTLMFANWNGGTIAPEGAGQNDAMIVPTWAVGANDDTMSGIYCTVIDSRNSPKYVAVAMHDGAPESGGYAGQNGGIRVLNAVDGSTVSVTNSGTVQTLTNIDFGNWYEGISFDGIGNLYASSTSANYWRVWSPPGANTNTVVAVAQVVIPAGVKITGITSVPTGSGCGNVTITFTGPSVAASTYQVKGSATVNGTYSTIAGVTITGSAGSYQATFSNCSTMFYIIEE